LSFKEKLSLFRDSNGQITIDTVIGAIVFFLGFYIFLVMYNVITNELLFPLLNNEEVIQHANTIKLIIVIIPVIMAVMGIVMIIRGMQRPPPQAAFFQG